MSTMQAPAGGASAGDDWCWVNEQAALDLISGKGSWRQYPAYANEAAARVGASSRYLSVMRSGAPVAVANLRTRRIPLAGQVTLISNGPVLLREASFWGEDLNLTGDILQRIARPLGLGEIILDPPIGWAINGLDAAACLPGFARDSSRPPYRTIVLPIGEDAQMRARLDGKWRRDLAKGESQGLKVVKSERPDDIRLLDPLLSELTKRKKFSMDQDTEFFARVAARTAGPEHIAIHLVYMDEMLVSGHIGAYSGDTATYLLGASRPEGLALRAAYVAQWAAIETARKAGLRWYDTGGIDPTGNADVHRFKKRMGGEEHTNAGMYSCAAPGIRGVALRGIRHAYRRLRK